MQEDIEVSFEENGNTIDCRLEPMEGENGIYYTVTILYATLVNGFPRSEIFCYDMIKDNATGNYEFKMHEEGIHPKIQSLEARLSDTIAKAAE
jgi:hypothetical protein